MCKSKGILFEYEVKIIYPFPGSE